MPFTVQFNLTPGVGYQIIAEIYRDTIEMPAGFPADLVLGRCLSDVGNETKWSLASLDRRRWMHFSGYNDDELPRLLLLIFTTMLDYDNDEAETMVNDMMLELAMNQVNFEAAVLDDQPTQDPL
jgi:hypothetical protein